MEEIKNNAPENIRNHILSQSDLYEILPFGKTKVKQLLAAGVLPTMKVGNAHVTTFDLLQEWIQKNIGKEIIFSGGKRNEKKRGKEISCCWAVRAFFGTSTEPCCLGK